MKRKIISLLAIIFLGVIHSFAQTQLEGRVVDESGEGLEGVSIVCINSRYRTMTDKTGAFRIIKPQSADTLRLTHLGYRDLKVSVGSTAKSPLHFILQTDRNVLQEVEINTGYYSVPKERATGSFVHIDQEILSRSVSPNILDRLEGVAGGLLFDRRNLTDEDVNGKPELRIRGMSTIEANSEPLLVVDNFPFEGDINAINANEVESVTILRDAAAASIWGARAGNGVIVITTKRGHYDQPIQVSWNGSMNVIEKPDLFYSQQYLPSETVMRIQRELFDRNAYVESDYTFLPGYVELLIKNRDGLISKEDFTKQENYMRQTDLRKQSMDYLYRKAINQQYALNIQGGSGNYAYSVFAGHGRDLSGIVGKSSNQTSMALTNSVKLRPNLEIGGVFRYSNGVSRNNGIPMDRQAYIYEGLVDEGGNPKSLRSFYRMRIYENAIDQGLLDWLERPLDEIRLNDNESRNRDMRFQTSLNYKPFHDIDISANYTYGQSNSWGREIHDENSYFVRNLVNQFTQADGTQLIPHNNIIDYFAGNQLVSNSGRIQVNYRKDFSIQHSLTALSGAEVGQTVSTVEPGVRLYDYDRDTWLGSALFDYKGYYPTRPLGAASIPILSYSPDKITNRNLSYFGNASYSYLARYMLSGSVRWDGSNLLGVKTNQRGTALWSAGASWELSAEPFYKLGGLPYVRIRSTYGSAGNIDKGQSHYPTIQVVMNNVSGLLQSNLTSPGNPSLRWEQVNTFNTGLDWRIKNGRIGGSLEFYVKNASNLLGTNLMDPTTGVPVTSNYKMNYGALRTKGWDLQIDTRNLVGELSWNSVWLISHSENRITQLNRPVTRYAYEFARSKIPEKGKSVDILYALPWWGLDNGNGMPIIYTDGNPTTDPKAYELFVRGLSYEDLVNAGTQVPTLFGSLRNNLSWKGFQLDFMIKFKFGHVFRRKSFSPGEEYYTALFSPYHMDYFQRWEKPGDEKRTTVPAWAPNNEAGRTLYYTLSEPLVTKGDLIRLQDLNFSYSFERLTSKSIGFSKLSCFLYAKNLGILWRANKVGIDPDYPNAAFPAARSFAVGISGSF